MIAKYEFQSEEDEVSKFFNTGKVHRYLLHVARTLSLTILLSSGGQHTFAAASKCSDDGTIQTVKELEGGTSSLLKVYEAMGARIEITIDAIRTVSSSPNGALCEARLTIRSINIKEEQKLSGAKAEEGAKLERELKEMQSKKVSEIGYKVEITDDGQDYITIIPSEADVRQQEYRQQQHDQFIQSSREQQDRLDEQMRQDEMRAQGIR